MSDFCILRELLKPPPEAREGQRRVWINERGRTPYWQFVDVPRPPNIGLPDFTRFIFTMRRDPYAEPMVISTPFAWNMEYEKYLPPPHIWNRLAPLVTESPNILSELTKRDRDFRHYTYVRMRNNLPYHI